MRRYQVGHNTLNTNVEIRVEIHDALQGSASDDVLVGSGVFDYSHQRLDPNQYTEIQSGELGVGVHIQTNAHRTLRNDIINSSEGRFELHLYFDDVFEWKGTILPDLCSFTESFDEVLTLKAKDFTLLKRNNFTLATTRETIITTIESILSDFNLPVITATSWIESNTTSGNDFLRQIYHDRTALRQFTERGEPDIQITNEEALRWILRGYGLTLKQSGGALRIDQFTAYEDPTAVLLSTYNSGFDSATTSNVTQSATVTIESDNKPNAGLKRVKNTFDHRTQTSLPTIPQSIIIEDDPETFDFSIAPSGQTVRLSCSVGVPTDFEPSGFNSQPEGGVRVRIIIKAGQYYWNGQEWTETFASLDQNLTTTFIGGQFIGNYSVLTSALPADTDSTFKITFNPAVTLEDVDWNITQTEYFSIEFELDTEGINESIQFELVNADSYTLELTYPTTYFGDGPLLESPSALRYSTTLADLTSNSWQRRGGGTNRLFHSNLLHEILDPRRGARRVLNGTIKSKFEPHKVLSYDGAYFYYLGGTFDGYTGDWSVQLVRIEIQDNEEVIQTIFEQRIQSLINGLGGVVNLTTRDLRRLLGITNAIGVTTLDYDNVATDTLAVELNVPMRSGIEYWVVNVDQLDWRDLQAGINSVVPIFVADERIDYGTGTVDIEEQIIDAPSGSLIFKAPAQAEIDDNIGEEKDEEFDEKIEELDDNLDLLDLKLIELDAELDNLNNVQLPALQSNLDNLNDTVIPNLNTELNTLDGYFNNPATIPAGYSFFTGIVANNVFTQTLVAKNAFVEELAALNLFANTIVANDTFTDTLTAKTAFVNSLVANNVFTDELVAKNGFIATLVARDFFTDTLTAKNAFIVSLMGKELILRSGGFIRSTSYSAGVSGLLIEANGNAEFNNVEIRGELITPNRVLNPPMLTSAIANGTWTGSGTTYSVSWTFTTEVLSTDRISIIYYRNGVQVGKKSGILTTATPNSETISGGASGHEIYVTVILTRSGDPISSITTFPVPQLL